MTNANATAMTAQQLHDELVGQARRLVGLSVVESHNVSINDIAGTVRHRVYDTLLHYESGVVLEWHPWRPQYWASA